jgi:hypothetical protein
VIAYNRTQPVRDGAMAQWFRGRNASAPGLSSPPSSVSATLPFTLTEDCQGSSRVRLRTQPYLATGPC